jgi:hypothetical protein
MTKEVVIEVINKLIGPIRPCGESGVDSERLENIKLYIAVFDEMHTVIDDIAWRYKDSPYASEKQIGMRCKIQIDEMGIPE